MVKRPSFNLLDSLLQEVCILTKPQIGVLYYGLKKACLTLRANLCKSMCNTTVKITLCYEKGSLNRPTNGLENSLWLKAVRIYPCWQVEIKSDRQNSCAGECLSCLRQNFLVPTNIFRLFTGTRRSFWHQLNF